MKKKYPRQEGLFEIMDIFYSGIGTDTGAVEGGSGLEPSRRCRISSTSLLDAPWYSSTRKSYFLAMIELGFEKASIPRTFLRSAALAGSSSHFLNLRVLETKARSRALA